MSYQVLARKWRPRIFREMVGQEHVLQALINALDHNRLHHAYLFTGTRGVGKTTIARILAKCLNCETGVSSEPCGQCSSCREIAEGRFVDLIEVDAASRTKVEDTRELLENVQYAPTRGRYKVYLIDEVHMLSNSSFNALLKTLEEPPPHVKFLLATTDPQKLPMTILSRCLQFNLKNMNPERIVQHLKFVLGEELVPFEEAALWHLGRAADGSMRDAMSLTDQAIAYGSGKITEVEVSTMLGTIDQTAVYDIVNALASLDGRAVLAAVERMSEQAPDYANALAEMLAVLHRIAIAQALPEAVDNSHGDRERIMQLAQQLPSEDVQLFYQTALLGRRDLPLAPDARAGFEMVLLRMLAFKPQGVIDVPTQALPQGQQPKVVQAAPVVNQVQSVSQVQEVNQAPVINQTPVVNTPAAAPVVAPVPVAETPVQVAATSASHTPPAEEPPVMDAASVPDDEYAEYAQAPAYYDVPATEPAAATQEVSQPKKPEAALPPVVAAPELPPAAKTIRKVPYEQATPADWTDIYLGLGVTGILQSTVANCQMTGRQGNEFFFVLDETNSTLFDVSHEKRLQDLLVDYFVEQVKVRIQVGKVTAETPAQMAIRLRAERLDDAIKSIKNDPVVQQLIAQFGATLNEESIQPI
ncbi:DNA polymerase III subunit gamma/tau [Cellvibrio sp. pealriver]|uniref:DNA polymerase III subunit gamma/tau n=1 Tax=Cellvibrio sp. pealriver TaxID=1622269 RepID=UPI00066FE6AD|nr:DNA polymerase III subunit gamma/tau [Cellvibrio sp. pealriver]